MFGGSSPEEAAPRATVPGPPICPYCGRAARLVGGAVIYPNIPDLHYKKFWQCRPCDAHVGCHPDSTRPLGSPANKPLRQARREAHRCFDKLWKSGSRPRREAYARLAAALGLAAEDCHIGQFDEATCRRAVAAVSELQAGG